jgi:predicted Zn-dependent protease
MRLLLIVTFSFLLFGSCSKNPVTGKRDLMFMSENQEIAMGVGYDPQIVSMYGSYNDPKLQNFINEKGNSMAEISHRPHLDWTFRLLDSPVVNAFAVPGGFVYFTRGIMAHFNNEAEFAGVLGHEIGHITARHSARQQSRQILAQLGLIAGMIVSEDFRNYADIASAGLGILFLKYSRDHETESDKLGVEYSTEVGYNAEEMAYFFNTLKRLSGNGGALPNFLSTHPDPGDRYNNVLNLARQMRMNRNLDINLLKVNRNGYLQMIDGMVYGEDPRQGFVENFVFYHPELKFRFNVPQNWKTINTPSMVQMSPDNGEAVLMLTLEEGNSLDAAVQAVLERNKLREVERSQTTVNNIPARAVIAEQIPQAEEQGAPIRVLIYLLQYNGLIYNMTGAAKIENFNNYFGTFSSSCRSFQQLTDPEKLNRQPERIKVLTVNQDNNIRNLLLADGIPESRLNEMTILNGMEPDNVVKAGTLIKSVRRNSN